MPQADCRPAWAAGTLEHPCDQDATQAHSECAGCMTWPTHTADQNLLATRQVSSEDKASLPCFHSYPFKGKSRIRFWSGDARLHIRTSRLLQGSMTGQVQHSVCQARSKGSTLRLLMEQAKKHGGHQMKSGCSSPGQCSCRSSIQVPQQPPLLQGPRSPLHTWPSCSWPSQGWSCRRQMS